MKYYILKALVSYLKDQFTAIKFIKRVNNNTVLIEFNNKNEIYFDMSKGASLVYKKNNENLAKKDFNAPFDTLLQKRFINAKINDITLHNDDKIIRFYVSSKSSYKSLTTILQFEFTGKHTNIIILGDDEITLEALRHIDSFSSSRVVKVGEKLDEIPKQSFVPKSESIESLEKLLYQVYAQKEHNELENLKKQKLSQLKKSSKKVQNIINDLPNKQELEKTSAALYEKASLILNNLHAIKPYQSTAEVYDFQGGLIKLELDSKGNPSLYANELFKKAKKLKKKSQNISIEKRNLEEKSNFIKRMKQNIEKANSIDEIEFLMPKKQKNQTRTKKAEPYESFFFQGFKIMLGNNEHSNVYLLKNSRASDFWFHLKDRNSSHVIVQNTKKSLPIDVIEKAAQLCAKFSVDFSGDYLVDFTQRRNVKVQNGANVLYNPYDTFKVKI